VRDWPELEVVALQRGSDTSESHTGVPGALGEAAPGAQTRAGELGIGHGVAATSSHGACFPPLGRQRTQVSGGRGRVRVGPRLELAIGAAGEAA